MTQIYDIDFEGGTDGTAVPAAISGSSVVSTFNYSAADAVHGSMGARTSVAAGAGYKLLKGSTSSVYSGSIYITPRTFTTGSIKPVVFMSSGSTVIGSIRLNFSTGVYDIANNTTAVGTSSTAWSDNTTHRLDFQLDNSTSGTYIVTAKIFTDPESTTPDETFSATITSATVLGIIQFGQPGNVANTLGFDDVRLWDTLLWPTPIDPSSPPPPPPVTGEFYYETFEDGTDGIAVPSGGDISAVTPTTIYSAADATHGSLGVRTSGGSGAGIRIPKSTLSNSHTGSIYVIPDTISATGGAPRFVVFTSSASAFIGSLRFNNSTGTFDIGGPGSTQAAAGSTVWLAGRTYRVDWQFDGSTSGTYNITAKIFASDPEGTTPDETITASIASSTVFGQFIFGQPANTGSTVGFDSIRIYDGVGFWPDPINSGAPPPPPPPGNPGTWNFSWVGAPTTSSISVSTYVTAGTSLACKASTASDMSVIVATVSSVTPDATTGIAKFDLTGLTPNTQYYYQIYDTPTNGSQTAIGEIGKAKTLKPAGSAQSFKFAFGGCVTNNADVHAAFDDIRLNYQPDFMIHMGDFHYQNPTSTVDTDHINFWKGQIAGANGYHNLIRDMPMFYIRSDHDAGPADNGDSDNSSNQASINGYKKIVPYPASGFLADTRSPTAGLYFSFAVGRVRFIFIDIRNMDRSPGLNADSSAKTMLGATQLAWLKARLLDAEPVKIIVSDVAWSGPYSTSNGEDKWWSYNSERAVISNFIAANNLQVIMLTSDTHCLLCDNGGLNQWGGFPIFGAAPFANVGGGRNITYYQGVYNTTQTVQGSQYGRVAVTDDGTNIVVSYSGYDVIHATTQISQTITYAADSPPGMTFSVWNGTTEIPLTGTIWNGTSELRIASNTLIDPLFGHLPVTNEVFNPSAEASGSSFGASSNATVTTGSTDWSDVGVGSAKLTVNAIDSETSPTTETYLALPGTFDCVAGDIFDVVASIKAGPNASNITIVPSLYEYNYDGTTMTGVSKIISLPAVTLAPNAEVDYSHRGTIVAPTSGTVNGTLILFYILGADGVSAPSVGSTFYLDRILVAKNSAVPVDPISFFDGDTNGSAWDGTPNASSSTRTR